MTENRVKNPRNDQPRFSSQAILDFCRELIKGLGMELMLEAKEESGIIYVNCSGADRPLLLSNSAALLNSLEYLANKVFGMGKNGMPSIVLDSDNYRQHRESELVLLAQMASKKVISQRKPLSLQPMIPRERRIVHLALAGIEGVRSQSEGQGENRSITIYPS